MKLVELLAKEMNEWPRFTEGGDSLEQDYDNSIIEGHGCGTLELFMLSSRADDFPHAHVTRAQWQAERDRQKGGEWKRHRGGKQPVADDVRVEVKLLDGDIQEAKASAFLWNHSDCDVYANIMQFRVISQPQAEEVEVIAPGDAREYKGPFPCAPAGEPVTELEWDIQFQQGIFHMEAKTDQIDGPIKWRDTIIHCQAIIEDCERDIECNVQLLDAEGLMMQVDSKKAMQHYAKDVLPSEEWKAGDIVASITNCKGQFSVDSEYEIELVRDGRIEIVADDSGDRNGWGVDNFKFIRHP